MNRMRRTSLMSVLGLVAIAVVLGRLAPPLIIRAGGNVPRISWAAALLLIAAAIGVGVLAWNTWQSLHKKNRRMTSQHGVTMLSLARAAATVGALAAGFYGGFALAYLGELDTMLGQERCVRSAVASGASVLLLIAALLLERACVVPTDDDDDAQRQSGASPA